MKVLPGPYLGPPPDIASMVGMICAAWQSIELIIDQSIWRLSGLSQKRGLCFTAYMQFTLKSDVLRALTQTKFNDDALTKALGNLLDGQIRSAKAIRDRYAHSTWLMNTNGDGVIIQKHPVRHIAELESINPTIEEAVAAYAKMLRAWARMLAFQVDLLGGRPLSDASLGKLPEPASLYDQLAQARSGHRAKRRKHRRQP